MDKGERNHVTRAEWNEEQRIGSGNKMEKKESFGMGIWIEQAMENRNWEWGNE